MRTAKTVAETHDGKEVLVFGRKVPVMEQQQAFRDLQGQESHPEFAIVTYQERDGVERILRFRTADEQKAHEEARASERKAHKEFIEGSKKRAEEATAKASEEAKKKTEAEVEAHSKNIEKIKSEQSAKKTK